MRTFLLPCPNQATKPCQKWSEDYFAHVNTAFRFRNVMNPSQLLWVHSQISSVLKEMNMTFSSLLPLYKPGDKLLSHVSLQWWQQQTFKQKGERISYPKPSFLTGKLSFPNPFSISPHEKNTQVPRTSWHWRPLVPHLVASVATPTRNLPSAPARNDLRYVNGILRSSCFFFQANNGSGGQVKTVPSTKWWSSQLLCKAVW